MCGSNVLYVVIPLPFSPVPVTLQALELWVAGLALGPALGTWAVLIYLALGFIGLRFFAEKIGPEALLSPSGGYLLGFLPGSWVTGMLSSEESNSHGPAKGKALTCVPSIEYAWRGIAVVHTIAFFTWRKLPECPLSQAMLVGTVPFLPGDIFKSLLASILARKEQRRAQALLRA